MTLLRLAMVVAMIGLVAFMLGFFVKAKKLDLEPRGQPRGFLFYGFWKDFVVKWGYDK